MRRAIVGAAWALALGLVAVASPAGADNGDGPPGQSLNNYVGGGGRDDAAFDQGRRLGASWVDARGDFEEKSAVEKEIEDLAEDAGPDDQSKLEGLEEGLNEAIDYFKGSRNSYDAASRIRLYELRKAVRKARENFLKHIDDKNWDKALDQLLRYLDFR